MDRDDLYTAFIAGLIKSEATLGAEYQVHTVWEALETYGQLLLDEGQYVRHEKIQAAADVLRPFIKVY